MGTVLKVPETTRFLSLSGNVGVVARKYYRGKDLAFHLLDVSFPRELFIFGRSENKSECVVDVIFATLTHSAKNLMRPNIKEGCWICLILTQRNEGKKPTSLRYELKVLISFAAKTLVGKFISLRLNYDMAQAWAQYIP